ncbi:hypothetical protein K8352_18595, partial [Flavobacteriaceae bacterium F89]|nr:hypothetical protein [Cerina litoralis]
MKKLPYATILLFFVCSTLYSTVSENDKKVLLDLYHSTNGPGWTDTWDLEAPVSEWCGIKIKENHVVEIDLFENNLVGQLPESLGELQYLQSLNLAF